MLLCLSKIAYPVLLVFILILFPGVLGEDEWGDTGTIGDQDCDFAPLCGRKGAGPYTKCTAMTKPIVENEEIFAHYWTGKTPGTSRNSKTSKCRDLSETVIRTQSPQGDFILFDNSCMYITGWKKIVVFDSKRCGTGPNKKPRAAAYDATAGYEKPKTMLEQANAGKYWCVAPGFRVKSFMYSA